MIKRALIAVHRWFGVALCLVFLIWFPTGIVMMYWGFPAVTPEDRLRRLPPLDPTKIALSPAAAYARLNLAEPPLRARLTTVDERPAYRFGLEKGEAVVFADTGDERVDVSAATMQRAAAAWTGLPADAATVQSVDVDQWTVEGQFRRLRPLAKYSWPDGQQVYVSSVSGEVVQHTTTRSRAWAYAGAIPHWLYFTPLRRDGPLWSRVVVWSSGVGALAALAGIVVGLWMYSPSRRYRLDGAPTGIPYRGQKRWHMVLGLIFGAGAVTWTSSGLLSMDPFPALADRPSRAQQEGVIPRALIEHLLDLTAFDSRPPRLALAELASLDVRELELRSFAGEPAYLAALDPPATRVVSVAGSPAEAFNSQRLMQVLSEAAREHGGVELRLIEQYDAYYLDRRRQRPLPVILARLHDPEGTRYYVDPKTARIVESYSSRSWPTRWLYHGLHSLDLPWLYNNRPLWDAVVMTFMLGGTALCATAVMLAWRVVGRTLARPDRLR